MPKACASLVFTADLYVHRGLAEECQVKRVALESTGVYWIPLFEVLEEKGLEVRLVDARKVKNVSGRKSDLLDCQWLRQLHSYGLLAGAFRPAQEILPLRAYLRQRPDAGAVRGQTYQAYAKGAATDECAAGQRGDRHHGLDRDAHHQSDPGGRARCQEVSSGQPARGLSHVRRK